MIGEIIKLGLFILVGTFIVVFTINTIRLFIKKQKSKTKENKKDSNSKDVK